MGGGREKKGGKRKEGGQEKVGGREEKVGERGGREREAGESGREEMEGGPEEGGRVSSAQLKCGGRFTEWLIELQWMQLYPHKKKVMCQMMRYAHHLIEVCLIWNNSFCTSVSALSLVTPPLHCWWYCFAPRPHY